MFGRKSRVAHHPGGATITRTHHTTHTTTPHHSHAPRSGGIMNRLRPRRNTPPMHGSYGAPVVAPVATTRYHTTHRSKPILGRKKRAHAPRHHHATTTTAVPARKASLGDKVSGAMLKLRGSLSGRPAQEAAGERRMHGQAPRRYY